MTILVTGGAGYIGSHACVELLEAGWDIAVVDNFSNSSPESLKRVMEITGKKFQTYQIDILQQAELEKVFAAHDIAAVMHFAGLKAVGESMQEPLWYYRNNVIGTIILCEVMRKFQVKKMIFSSSATVYGANRNMPLQEDFPLCAINPYGRTKQLIEALLGDIFAADPEWSIGILRYFNPAGAHESGLIGEDPRGIPNNLLPYIAQVAIGKRDQLHIFGHDYPTTDGTGVRDYIHVVDLVQGHVKALEKILHKPGISAYNLGTGKGYSVLEVVHAFQKATGQHIPYQLTKRRPGDAAICYADPAKAKMELDWEAERSLENMCADMWRWQRTNPNGYLCPAVNNNNDDKTPAFDRAVFF